MNWSSRSRHAAPAFSTHVHTRTHRILCASLATRLTFLSSPLPSSLGHVSSFDPTSSLASSTPLPLPMRQIKFTPKTCTASPTIAQDLALLGTSFASAVLLTQSLNRKKYIICAVMF
ncbi:hypothetical protein IF1G_03912 [Cordyceps javanica]|uniref:Uncharacterized protein n=1 Tax=Cordyceps javanica TaxID=43265 RepID=A0A545V977_9HYPO|nr:hypothetical protein IF1G_03912 [Cordyceps javanica]